MPKIFITLKDISAQGGGERVCANLANAFSNYLKIEVHILSFFKENENLAFSLNENIKIQYFKKIKNNFLGKLLDKTIFRFYISYKIHRILKKQAQNGDIVLANDGLFIPFLKVKNIKYLRLWHLKAPKNIEKRARNLARFDTLIILTNDDLNLWQQYHNNVVVIPNFLPNFPKEKVDFNNKNIISVGRLSREKGFDRLIDIFLLLSKNSKLDEWNLIIVGSGPLKNDLESKIKSLNLENRITIKPFTKDINKEYLNASIYALTSRFEGFPMVLIESASFCMSNIAFNVKNGPSDIIMDSKTGFLVEDGDLDSFAEKLKILMLDSNLRKIFGNNARENVESKFSKYKVLAKWKEIINN